MSTSRYLVFGGSNFYPGGGMTDLIEDVLSDLHTIEARIEHNPDRSYSRVTYLALIDGAERHLDWIEVIEHSTMNIVLEK